MMQSSFWSGATNQPTIPKITKNVAPSSSLMAQLAHKCKCKIPLLVVREQAGPFRPDGGERRGRRDDVEPPREERRVGVHVSSAAARERLGDRCRVLVAAPDGALHRRGAPLLLLESDAASVAQGLHKVQNY
jgi:hypothetical protein